MQFAENFKGVIDATFRGQVITSLTEGVFIGIGMAVAGIPGAILWGAVATVLSLLPVVGAAVVWIPAALYLFVAASIGEQSYFAAIFLTVWGVIVVPVIEHVVRPWAMKGKMQLPAIPLLVSVLGGMEAFGFVGLVVGPLVARSTRDYTEVTFSTRDNFTVGFFQDGQAQQGIARLGAGQSFLGFRITELQSIRGAVTQARDYVANRRVSWESR